MTAAGSADVSALEARLSRLGRLYGADCSVVPGTGWRVTASGIEIGRDSLVPAGHSPAEAQALTLVHLWRLVFLPRQHPELTRRRLAVAAAFAELEPLLAVLDVLLAARAVVTAFPGEAPALTAAISRRVSGPDDGETPRHLRLLEWLLGFGGGSTPAAPSPQLAAACAAHTPDGVDWAGAVRLLLDSPPHASAFALWEGLLALTLEPYDALLRADLRDRGIDPDRGRSGGRERGEDRAELGLSAAAGDDAASDDAAGGDAGNDVANGDAGNSGAGDNTAGDNTAGDDSAGSDGEAVPRPEATPRADPDTERARAGGDRHTPEGADLFAGQQAAFVTRVIATPIALADAAAAALADTAETGTARASAHNFDLSGGGGAAPAASASGGMLAYRAKTRKYAREIEQIRQAWLRVRAAELTPRRVRAAAPSPQGAELAPEHLAAAVAETRAGARQPSAFQTFRTRARRRDEARHTDYVFVIDRSASMRGITAEHTADAVLMLLEALAGVARDLESLAERYDSDFGVGIRTALVLFDETAHVLKPLSSAMTATVRQRLHEEIQLPQGPTNDGVALACAERLLREQPGNPAHGPRNRVVIVVGDGGSHDADRAARQLRRLRAAGTEVIALGVGATGAEMVRRYAPAGHWVPQPRDLPRVFTDIVTRRLSLTNRYPSSGSAGAVGEARAADSAGAAGSVSSDGPARSVGAAGAAGSATGSGGTP